MRSHFAVFVLIAAVTAASATAAPPASDPGTVAPAESAPPSPKAGSLAAKMWWNQAKKVDELRLSDAQRATMDSALQRFLAVRSGAIRRQKEAFAAYGDALASGDTAAIEARGEALRTEMSAPLEAQVTLMAEVTATLEARQRRLLVERYPKLLSRQWIRSGRTAGLGRGR